MKRKKRKLNEISKSENEVISLQTSKQTEFKEPGAHPKKSIQEIKECPFNPFGMNLVICVGHDQ
jgi:hypothetical protein